MSNTVDRNGTFRFDKVLEAGVGAKGDGSGGYKNVSFNVRLHLSAFYDEQEREWVDWSEYDVEIQAYLYLFGIDKKTKKFGSIFHHEAVMNVFGWDGKSFSILANNDYSKTTGQVRIVDNDPEYADKNPFQVANIDVFDADPSSQLRSLDPTALKDLDVKFAQVLQASGKAPTPATVPAKKSTKPKPPTKATAKPAKATATEVVELEDKQAILKAKSERLKNAKKTGPQPPIRAAIPLPIQAPAENKGDNKMTKQQAWEFCVEMKNDACDDEQLQASWSGTINQIAGEGVADEDITDEQWTQIANTVIDETGKF